MLDEFIDYYSTKSYSLYELVTVLIVVCLLMLLAFAYGYDILASHCVQWDNRCLQNGQLVECDADNEIFTKSLRANYFDNVTVEEQYGNK